MIDSSTVSIAFVGSGGAGALTTGRLLLEAACLAGWNGLLTRSVGPQIRGGEAAAIIRLAVNPVECHSERIDLLVGIDWLNANRFEAELPLASSSIVLNDPAGEPVPTLVSRAGCRIMELPLGALVKATPQLRPNMIALGAAAEMLGVDLRTLDMLIEKRFADRGEAAVTASRAAVRTGAEQVRGQLLPVSLGQPRKAVGKRWLLTGNEAAGLGALRGGIRFVAAYPITPASEILEWLAPNLAQVGGILIQAEDEIASINMIIGSSFGGVPSLTATSGPGLSLMVEALGLGTAAEVPVVVVDVMRGGPSTGIPTKSEQADLNIAVYGMHGSAPHLVLAPQSVPDCLLTTQWAVHLAEALQTPAIVLSDQFLGQTVAAIERPPDIAFAGRRAVASDITDSYRRYSLTGNGVSPMVVPGTPGGQYTADGLTHTERGLPTSSASDHRAQLDKRRDKLEQFEYGDTWATLEGSGPLAILTWGSLTGAAREAIGLLAGQGHRVRLIAPRLLLPTRPREMTAALTGVTRLLVVEQSHDEQFFRYLRAHYRLPDDTALLSQPGPLPIRPCDIQRALLREETP